MIDGEQIMIWLEKRSKTKRPSNLNMLHIWFGTILMIYLIVWFFSISASFHLSLAICGNVDLTLSLLLLSSNELFTSNFLYVNLLPFPCNKAYRVDDAVHSLEYRHICFDVFLFVFLTHTHTIPLSIFFHLNTAILHPINCIGEHILFWIWFAWMPKWKSVLWYRCSFFAFAAALP